MFSDVQIIYLIKSDKQVFLYITMNHGKMHITI